MCGQRAINGELPQAAELQAGICTKDEPAFPVIFFRFRRAKRTLGWIEVDNQAFYFHLEQPKIRRRCVKGQRFGPFRLLACHYILLSVATLL